MWWTSPSPSPYRDLDRGKKEIRLVTLKPRRGWSVRPECELSTVSIDEKPVYTALSYVWGPRVLRNSILLNGKDFKVTDSLYCALLRLRDKTQPCTLWIDAICINQGDREERASQVRLVREIYSSAASTVVYLGEKGPSTLPMELLKMLPSDGNPYNMRELAYNAELSKHWRDLSLMIKNEYWERCWTLQEIIVSDNITILYGNESTTWEKLNLLRGLSHGDRLPYDCHLAVCAYTLRVQPTHMWYSDARAGKRMSMLEALLLTNYRRSSEEQDKVFSLLGLVDAGGIEPDYNLHPADVYRRTVQRIVEMEESLEVLSAVRELRTEPLFERIEEESRKYRHEWKDFTSSGGPLDDTAQDADIIIHPPAVDTSSGRPRSEMDSGGDLLSSWSFQPGYQDRSRRPIYTESKTRPQDKIVPFGASGTSKPEVRFLGAVMELDGVVLSRVRPGPHSGANGSEIRYLNSKRSGTPLCDHEKMLEQACRPLWEHFIAHGAIWQHGLQTWRSVYGSPFDTLRAFQNTLLLGQEGPQTGDDTQFDVDLDRRFLWTGVTGLHPDELKNIEPSLPSHELLHTMFQRTLDTRSFFVTQNGYMGFASMEVAAGDVVCLLKGGPTPYILRPYDATGGDGHFYFVCDCYVHGIMRGEAWSKYADGTVPLQTIRII